MKGVNKLYCTMHQYLCFYRLSSFTNGSLHLLMTSAQHQRLISSGGLLENLSWRIYGCLRHKKRTIDNDIEMFLDNFRWIWEVFLAHSGHV